MRFATTKLKQKDEIIFGYGLNTDHWFAWSDLQAKVGTEKIITTTHSLLELIQRSSVLLPWLKSNQKLCETLPSHSNSEIHFSMPFRPLAFRDFYCFEEHVKRGRKSRGLDMIPEWYEAPIFYYSNHLSFRGPEEKLEFPDTVTELDCELEIACIVGSEILNASVAEAEKAIFGYTVLNDWSARDLQRFEMKVNMGPAKGKDFYTTFGSYIITPDEIQNLKTEKGYDIEFDCHINGELLTRNNWKKLQFSFEEMLVRASKNCRVYPGEVIASGTMGGGCLLEYNAERADKKWIKKGDRVDMRWLDQGPQLKNQIV